MTPTTTLTLVDGVRIVVPDSLDLITPYVLREQLDWFEDEIKFLRRLLQPGQSVIDVGANYGVYTLSMAQTVGPAGHVWAFEPASSTANLLADGIAANGFSHVTLIRSALSSAAGTAQLSLSPHSELNALMRGALQGASETVRVGTLDECMGIYDWREIDFAKIDAEGEEANILKGGQRFFAERSPLIQYEVKAGQNLHIELVHAFAALGYESYRLVPGLDVLVPFDAESPPDPFLLNLFCCKPDRARQLVVRGVLVDSAAVHEPPKHAKKGWFGNAWDALRRRDPYHWRNTLANLPYGAQLASRWEQHMASGQGGDVEEALSLYACSRDASLSAAERLGALQSSVDRFKRLCDSDPSHLRLVSLARVARAFGARMMAVDALAQLTNTMAQGNWPDPSEPFLAPGERFDSVSLGSAFGNWILAAALEELERAGSLSSFYSSAASKQRLEIIRDLGFGDAEMQRRLSLVQQRLGMPT